MGFASQVGVLSALCPPKSTNTTGGRRAAEPPPKGRRLSRPKVRRSETFVAPVRSTGARAEPWAGRISPGSPPSGFAHAADFRCARPQSLGHEVTTPLHKTDDYTPQIDLTVSPNIKSRFGDGVTEAVAPVVSRPTLCECLWHPAEGCAKWTEGRACAHKYKACSYTHKFWSLRDPRAPRASAPLFAAAGPVPVLCVQFVKV